MAPNIRPDSGWHSLSKPRTETYARGSRGIGEPPDRWVRWPKNEPVRPLSSSAHGGRVRARSRRGPSNVLRNKHPAKSDSVS